MEEYIRFNVHVSALNIDIFYVFPGRIYIQNIFAGPNIS